MINFMTLTSGIFLAKEKQVEIVMVELDGWKGFSRESKESARILCEVHECLLMVL